MSLLSRRGTRFRTPEADPLFADPSPTAYGFALRRALGSGQESTTTSNTLLSSETLSSSPSPSTGSGRQGISQTVLEWIFVVIALGLLIILIVWRCTYVRYRNRRLLGSWSNSNSHGRRPATSYHSRARNLQYLPPAHIRDSEDLTNGPAYDRRTRALVLSPSFLHTGLMPLVDGRGVQINTPPNVTQPRVRGYRVRGLDVDEGGRRAGGGGEYGDETGASGPADELPAYEIGKGPPGYQVAIGDTARPDIVQVGLPARADQYLQHSEESANVDSSSPRETPEYTSNAIHPHAQSRGPGGVSPPSPDSLPSPPCHSLPSSSTDVPGLASNIPP